MLALVTGGTGFIGKAVCARFAQAGWQVRSLSRHPGASSHVVADLERDDLSAAVAGADVVVHLAGRAHVLRERDPDAAGLYRRANVTATERLALAARAAGVERIVFASTVKVHGETTEGRGPYTEGDAPAPQDDYARSKREAEEALWRSGQPAVVVRPPLVYGQGVGANFRRLMGLVQSGMPLPLASVANRRSLVFVHNLADALYACATHPGAIGRTYLVTDREDVSTPQLMRLVAGSLGRDARLFRFPVALLRTAAALAGRGEEAGRLLDSMQADCSRLGAELGWRPPHSLEQGVRATAAWFAGER